MSNSTCVFVNDFHPILYLESEYLLCFQRVYWCNSAHTTQRHLGAENCKRVRTSNLASLRNHSVLVRVNGCVRIITRFWCVCLLFLSSRRSIRHQRKDAASRMLLMSRRPLCARAWKDLGRFGIIRNKPGCCLSAGRECHRDFQWDPLVSINALVRDADDFDRENLFKLFKPGSTSLPACGFGFDVYCREKRDETV